MSHEEDHGSRHIAGGPDNLGTRTRKAPLDFIGKGAGASKTTTTIQDNVLGEVFSIGDEVFFGGIIPDDYDGGDATIRIHFIPMGSEITKEVNWQIDYTTIVNGDLISGTTGTVSTGDIVLSSTAFTHQTANLTIPEVDLTGKDEIFVKVSRIAIIDGDNPASNPMMVHGEVSATVKRLI